MNSGSKFLPVAKPDTGPRERELLVEALESGWVAQGPKVAAFEKAFADYTGIPHAVAVSSGTAALHLTVAALGIGPGDEVIVPSFTFVATANAVEYTGARAVLCDIDLATYNLDIASAERCITKATRAIIPVSLFGLPMDMEAVNALARAHNLLVIEDAACALGAWRGECHAGSEALAAAFSFHPRKIITTGEGGMVATRDPELAERVASLRNHGAEAALIEGGGPAPGYLMPRYDRLGYNYRLTDLQGAMGLAQMERLEGILARRRAVVDMYREAFKGMDEAILPTEPPGCRHAYQSFVLLCSPEPAPALSALPSLNRRRNVWMDRMEVNGIQVRQGTHAVHLLGYYANKYGIVPESLPNSLMADKLTLALPLFGGMEPGDVQRVAGMLA